MLALYPTSRGFAFALFEGSTNPVDWGVKDVKGPQKNSSTLEAIDKLTDQYEPDAVVLEDTSAKGTRRSARIRRLYTGVARHAAKKKIEVARYSCQEVRETFAPDGAFTKYEIAKTIARQIPAFAHRLPRFRKLWMSEDPRQGLFDALALGLVYYRDDGDSDNERQ